MSSGLGRTQRSVVEYLGEHDTATIWELAGALTNGGGQRYADSTGGESVIRRAVRRLYEDGRLVTRTEGSAVHYAMADEEHTDGWTAYVAEPRPKELAAMLAAAVQHFDQTEADGASDEEYDAAVRTLRDLAAAAAERGLYPVGGPSR